MPARARAYCFTYNNYDQEGIDRVQALAHKYLCYGKEVAPTTGTPHLQGLIIFSLQRSFNAVKNDLPGCHVEACVDSHAHMLYCKKEGDIYESGTAPRTPAEGGVMEQERYKRTWDAAKSGNLEDIDPDLRIRFYSTLKRIKADHQAKPAIMDVLDFHWWHGATGKGKSRKAHSENPDAYIKSTNKWWDSYDGQDTVHIEDWPQDQAYMAHYMKKWCDHYPFRGEIKGGTILLRPRKVIVTSNYSIRECFPNAQDYEPLERRFQVVNFSPPVGEYFSEAPIPSAEPVF